MRWAQATEMLDPGPFLRGGEVVLTTGMSLGSPDACRRFVDALVAARAVGIGYGIEVVTPTVPEALVQAADAAGLPVLSVPPSVPFVMFTERLAQEQARLWVITQERMAAGHLFDAVRRGLAEPVVLFERFADLDRRGAAYAAVCFSGRNPAAENRLAGPHRIGYVRDRTTVLGTAEAIAAFGAVAPADLPMGIAEPAGQAEIRRVLAEAVAAHEVASRRGGPATSRDLATVDGLLYRLTADQVAPFREHVLRPLAEHDQRRGGDLVATARALVELDGSVTRCAEALYLHPNTERKRLDRIDELTGLRVREPRGRLALEIALSAVLGASGASPDVGGQGDRDHRW